MRKIFHTITAVFVIMVFLSGMITTLPPKPAYAMSGIGTPEDPYIITSAQDLQDMNLNLSAYYALGGDIDCSVTSTWNDGQGFLPVGTWPTSFTGGLDGNNYTISNLYINRTDEGDGYEQGLFSYCESAVIQNLTLENFSIHARGYSAPLCSTFIYGNIANVHVVNATVDLTGIDYTDEGAAGLCAYIESSDAISCTVDGDTTVTGFSCGGMFHDIGYDCYIYDCTSSAHVIIYGGADYDYYGWGGVFCSGNLGEIERCVASGQIEVASGLAEIGGFIDWNEGVIRECYSTSTVQVTAGADETASAGFAGYNDGDIENCYARGSVTSTAGGDVGGFVGYASMSSLDYSGIYHCYSACVVSTGGYSGGFAAESYNDDSIYYCLWDTEISGTSVSAGGIGKTTAEMKTQSTFTDAGWDFTTIWDIDGVYNDGYPFLRTEASERLYEHYHRQYYDSSIEISNDYGEYHGRWAAQTFTASADQAAITAVRIKVFRSHGGSPPSYAMVSIRATDSDGKPTGPDLT